jgi:hypothetical protein
VEGEDVVYLNRHAGSGVAAGAVGFHSQMRPFDPRPLRASGEAAASGLLGAAVDSFNLCHLTLSCKSSPLLHPS